MAQQLANVAAMPMGETVPLEGTALTESGELVVVEGTARNLLDNEHVKAIVVTLRDTTDRRELEQQLERRAFHDELTGLAGTVPSSPTVSRPCLKLQPELRQRREVADASRRVTVSGAKTRLSTNGEPPPNSHFFDVTLGTRGSRDVFPESDLRSSHLGDRRRRGVAL